MTDKRVVRTRAALEQSFNEIFLVEGYGKTTPARVAEAARVGRSTFYEHFDGQDDLLERRLLRVLLPLADAARPEAVSGDLERLLDHFWDRRVIVRALLSGRARAVAMRALMRLIEDRIPAGQTESCVPPRLMAARIAGGHLALLEEWLSGRHRCSSFNLAQAIAAHASAQVLADERTATAFGRPGSATRR